MQHNATDTNHSALLLTVSEAAERLRIGRTLMYDLIRQGAVTSVRVGRLRRVRLGDLEAFTADLAPAPVRDIPTAAA
jgi:excisionase family DNA binding protein